MEGGREVVRALGKGGGGGGVALFHFKAGNMQKEIIGAASSKRESGCAAWLPAWAELFPSSPVNLHPSWKKVDFIPNKGKGK